MTVKGIELKAGQQWKTKSGKIGVLIDFHGYPYCFVMREGSHQTYTEDGRVYDGAECEEDLDELMDDCHEPQQTFTLRQLHDALKAHGIDYGLYMDIAAYLTKHADPDYLEYLRLKEKFKGDKE